MMRISFEGSPNEVLEDMTYFVKNAGINAHLPATPTAPAAPAAPATPATPATPTTPTTPAAPTVPIPTVPATPATPATPAAPMAPTNAPIPTAPAKEYTIDELAQAAAPLMDAGKTDALQAMLAKFGAVSMMDIPQDRYGELATELRALGARI